MSIRLGRQVIVNVWIFAPSAPCDYKPNVVGSNCFIRGPSVIDPRVVIGYGAIVSPLSFVERKVDRGAVFSDRRTMRAFDNRVAALEAELAALRETIEETS